MVAEAGRLDGLFERLAYEFGLSPELVADQAYLLGQASRRRRSLRPDHYRVIFRSLQEVRMSCLLSTSHLLSRIELLKVLSDIDFGELDASAVCSGWEKLGEMLIYSFEEGYR